MNFHTGYRCNVKDEKEMPSYDMMNVALRLSDKGSPSVGLAADQAGWQGEEVVGGSFHINCLLTHRVDDSSDYQPSQQNQFVNTQPKTSPFPAQFTQFFPVATIYPTEDITG